MLHLVKYLLDKGFDYVLTARFNQDKLENLFSQIRTRSKTPTPYEFKNALKIVTISQFLHQNKKGSYESDDATYIADFFSINPQAKKEMEVIEYDEDFILALMESDLSLVKTPVKEILYNLVGYLLNSIQKTNQVKCKECLSVLIASESEKNPLQSFVDLRDFTGHSLKRCSEDIFNSFFFPMEQMFAKLEQKNKNFVAEENIRDQLISHAKLQLPDPFHTCMSKTRDKLITRFITLRLKIDGKEYAKEKQTEYANKRKGMKSGSRSATMKKSVEII